MQGWECPKCGKCYAPHVDECKTCGGNTVTEGVVIPPYPPITTGGTINISATPITKSPFKIINAIGNGNGATYVKDANGTLIHINGKR